MLIEHSLDDQYTIVETPDPTEKTLETHRYQVDTPPGKITEFGVKEQVLRTRREELRNLSYQGLQRYFADKLLDEHAYEALKAVLDVWNEISRLEKTIAEQEQRRAKIYAAQEQAQKNMAVLSNAGEEGKLRGRYVKQLTQSEEQLAEIDQAVARLQAEIEQKQANVERMIAALGTG
jgi:DNA repair exonuclease SbcCD ATPase subunit